MSLNKGLRSIFKCGEKWVRDHPIVKAILIELVAKSLIEVVPQAISFLHHASHL